MNSTNADSPSALRAGTRAQGASHYQSFPRPRLLRLFLAMLASLIGASSNSLALPPAPPAPTPVAVSGTTAPAGGTYSSFGNFVLSGSGLVAFQANLTGGSSTGGIFVGTPGSLQSAALQGTAASAGGSYNVFFNTLLALNDSGQVAFRASLTGGSSSSGIFVGAPGSVQAVALLGTVAPAGGKYNNFLGSPVLNGAGQVAYTASLTSGSSISGIFAGAPGLVQAVALQGTTAPAGGIYSSPHYPVLNGAGQVAYHSNLAGGASGIFVGSPGSVQAAALSGTAAPAGGNYDGINHPVLNDSGQVAYVATLTGGTSPRGLFAGTPGSIQAVALQGTAAAAGGNYSVVGEPVLNASGQVAFRAILSGGSSSNGIFVGAPGSLQSIALAGTTPPDGVGKFDFFTSTTVALNASGQVAFTSYLSGTGVTTANDNGLYAGSVGNLVKIVREGDILDVDPGLGINLHTVSSIAFTPGSSGEDRRAMGLNDAGLMVYRLTFTDGSSGIFTSQIAAVPEPGTLGLLAAGGIVCWLGYRRRLGR